MNEHLDRMNKLKNEARSRDNRAKKGYKGKEKDLEKTCESYLKELGLRYIHIPDSLLAWIMGINPITKKHNTPPWVRVVISRAFKGVPDLLIFLDDKCLLVELKTATGKLSQGQKTWSKGVKVHVVREFFDFKELVDEFIS